jgi:endonuclease/exonuclease/phosphatase family metal-dependent hydrolase
VAIGSHRLATWNVHLESRGTDGLRIEQLKETLADAQRYKDTLPSVIGGDFNLVAAEGMAGDVLDDAGFHDAVGSRSPTTRGARPRRIDGIFVRGRKVEGGAVHTSVAASDHLPVSTRIY